MDPIADPLLVAESAARVQCPHAPPCGGCPLIDSTSDAQLALKRARLVDALAAHRETREQTVEPIAPASPIVGYRPRAKLVVASPARIGLYARGSHEVVDIPGCRVLAPEILDVADALRALLASPPPDAGLALITADARWGALLAIDLRHVAIAGPESSRSVLVTLVLDRARLPDERTLHVAAAAAMDASSRIAGVAFSVRDAGSPQILGAELRVFAGSSMLEERAAATAPITFARHGAFVQAHRAQAEALRERIVATVLASGARSVLELHGGSGGLAMSLARRGLDVTMIESFAPAANDARTAADAQGIVLDVRAKEASIELARMIAEGARFDAVVLDPPRRGVPPDVRAAIARLDPALVVYVSCHPPTLARDLADLAHRGYAAASITPFDMMPLTEEVETLVVLRRAPRPLPRVVHEDETWIAIDEPPHTSVAIHGANVALGLDETSSGVVLFAKDDRARSALDGLDVRIEHVVLVRGITRGSGTIRRPPPATTFERVEVVLGHSLLRAHTSSTGGAVDDALRLRRHLSSIGHPVLGDATRLGDRASNRYLFEKHGLDRPFLHRAVIELARRGDDASALRIEAPLASDLETLVATSRREGAGVTKPRAASRGSSGGARRRRG